MLLGYGLTGIVLGLFMAFALTDQCMSGSYGLSLCLPRWRVLTGAPFNEIGDALAGFAGALAFVWLIVTVLIQGRELAAQREELEATREVQEEQLKAMQAQALVFELEQRERVARRTDEDLDALLHDFFVLVARSNIDDFTWYTKTESVSQLSRSRPVIRIFQGNFEAAEDDAIFQWMKGLKREVEEIAAAVKAGSVTEFPKSVAPALAAKERLSEIHLLRKDASMGMKARLQRLGVSEGLGALTRLMSNVENWGARPQ